MKKAFVFLVILLSLSACTTARKRFIVGTGIGAFTAGGTAALLSPDSENRPINALVFGLSGALLGGAIGLFLHDDGTIPPSKDQLVEKERLHSSNISNSVPASSSGIPEFVKDRLTPVVIESYIEKDAVMEDGSIHEPHRVYRIKQPAELIATPLKTPKANNNRDTDK